MAKNSLLTRDQILTAPDLKTKDVEVPEWGGTVRVSQINAADRCTLQASIIGEDGKAKPRDEIMKAMTIGLCALAIVDENGNRLFTQADIEAFGKKCSEAVDRVFEAADELNGITAAMAERIRKN